MLEAYRQHVAERAALGIPPLPLDAQQTAAVIELLKAPPAGEDAFLLDLLTHRVPPGVDDAAKVKASFLSAVAHGDVVVPMLPKAKATELLGTMVGGYNVKPLIDLLGSTDVAQEAANALKKTLLMFDFFHDVAEKATAGNKFASEVIDSWSKAEWFTTRPEVPSKITVTVFKVTGETNTDDLSPRAARPPAAPTSRCMPSGDADERVRDASRQKQTASASWTAIHALTLEEEGQARRSYAGDVVWAPVRAASPPPTRVMWTTGEDIPFIPNKRSGGGGAGQHHRADLPSTRFRRRRRRCRSSSTSVQARGQWMTSSTIRPYAGERLQERQPEDRRPSSPEAVRRCSSTKYRAGGRTNLIIGRALTSQGARAPEAACVESHAISQADACDRPNRQGRLLAGAEDRRQARAACRKARSCARARSCEPKMTTVGSPGHHWPDDRATSSRSWPACASPRTWCCSPSATPPPIPKDGRCEDAPLTCRTFIVEAQRPERCARATASSTAGSTAPAAAGHGRHRRRQPHALPDRHQLPGRFGPGRLRRGDRLHAPGHAGVGAGALHRQAPARHHAARPGATPSRWVRAQKRRLLTLEKKPARSQRRSTGRILEIEGLERPHRRTGLRALATPRPNVRPPACVVNLSEESVIEPT